MNINHELLQFYIYKKLVKRKKSAEIIAECKKSGHGVREYLLTQEVITETSELEARAAYYCMPCVEIDMLDIQGYCYEGYAAHIYDMKSYFDENMKLLKEENLKGLFGPGQIYTKIRDDNPTRYIKGAKVSNVMAADGCVIEGEVENSILFRGVVIEKGAKVKNCILMQDTVVKAGAELEYVIADKDVVISENKELEGTDTYPIYITKGTTV